MRNGEKSAQQKQRILLGSAGNKDKHSAQARSEEPRALGHYFELVYFGRAVQPQTRLGKFFRKLSLVSLHIYLLLVFSLEHLFLEIVNRSKDIAL